MLIWELADIHYLYAFVSQIKGVYITDKAVIIKKMMGSITIPCDKIKGVSLKSSMIKDIRLCGISGLFGHIGLFTNMETGRYSAYAKDGNNLIAIYTNHRHYVVSCDNADKAVALLQKR